MTRWTSGDLGFNVSGRARRDDDGFRLEPLFVKASATTAVTRTPAPTVNSTAGRRERRSVLSPPFSRPRSGESFVLLGWCSSALRRVRVAEGTTAFGSTASSRPDRSAAAGDTARDGSDGCIASRSARAFACGVRRARLPCRERLSGTLRCREPPSARTAKPGSGRSMGPAGRTSAEFVDLAVITGGTGGPTTASATVADASGQLGGANGTNHVRFRHRTALVVVCCVVDVDALSGKDRMGSGHVTAAPGPWHPSLVAPSRAAETQVVPRGR